MATSAFRSTTRRTPAGKSSTSGEDDSGSSNRSSGHRRYRSLSRFSHRMLDLDAEVTPVRRGKFVNTVRGSGFPEISLDDLAVEFFDSFSASSEDRGRSSSRMSGVNSSGGGDRGSAASERRGRSASRGAGGNFGSGGRLFSETESSRRRSVSRGGDRSGGGSGRLETETESSRRQRSMSRSGVGNGGSSESSRRRRSVSRQPSRGTTGNGRLESEIGDSRRRRRSASVVPCPISDSESDQGHNAESGGRGNPKSSVKGNIHNSGSSKSAASDYRPGLRRSYSQNEFQYNDGYSSQSSAVTDDERKNTSCGKYGVERIIRAVHSQKKEEYPSGDNVNCELYEAMRKELRHAVDEIRTELEQSTSKTRKSMGNGGYGSNQKARDALHSVSTSTKGSESEKRKQDLITEILLEEQRGRELSKIVKELRNDPNDSADSEMPSLTGKGSKDKNRMSKCLTEEAEKYIEDFISSIEDTDISSVDGCLSETGSNSARTKTQTFQSPPLPKSAPVEMDGVMLPWLQWETSNDATPLPSKNMLQHTPSDHFFEVGSTPNASTGHSAAIQSISSMGSWSPSDSGTKSVNPKICQTRVSFNGPTKLKPDVDDYLNRKSDEDFLIESWKQRNRIGSGHMLLRCTNMFF